MSNLTPHDFGEFFFDVHGYEPFPWQRRLTEQVLDAGWPSIVDLPTGTGKTALLDIAVFALATNPEAAPRRIVFVIDRRIIVDQVCERARTIRDRIQAGNTVVLRRVRRRLRRLGGGDPLGVAALRGGIPMDSAWTHRPDQPWVLVSTVDQFGSRLLFRGYGVGRGMLPIHAGLAGNDCLVILDEVHLSVPFAETLAKVADLPTGSLPKRFRVVQMSATPGSESAESFQLDPVGDLEESEELRRRVRARKQGRLVSVRNRDSLPLAVLKCVQSLRKPGASLAAASVGVVVNRIRTAREAYQVLRDAGFRTHLITGRMRPLDRVAALNAVHPAVDPDRSDTPGEITIVVATQAIEVGADFSFDALITECAPIDSLRQRFGRLDRRGTYFVRTGTPAQAWILGLRSEVSSRKPDPIYGDSVKATWSALKRLERTSAIDIGSESLSAFPDTAMAPRSQAPLLLRTHMDAWVQTNPQPIVQPPIDWFLHGINREGTPEVSIIWRRDRTDRALKLVPPRQAESLSVPIDAAKSWLSGAPETEVADVQGFGQQDRDEGRRLSGCVRWRGTGKMVEQVESVGDIRPGDSLVVDPDRGGLLAYTWAPSSNGTVADLGDAAQEAHGRRVTLRLDPNLPETASLSFSPPLPSPDVEADLPAQDRIGEWLEAVRSDEPNSRPVWFSNVLERLGRGFECTLVEQHDADPNGYYVLSERNPVTGKPAIDPSALDGSDEAGSMTGSAVTLRQHLEGVAARVRKVGTNLGLPQETVDDLCLAARLHDIGKVDPRFQAQLVGGDPVALEMLDEPLAKSLPGVRRIQRYPRGMRHEIASVAMADSDPDVLASANDRDLVLHLIGTHHGWSRPLPPIIRDPDPQRLALSCDGLMIDSGSDLSSGALAYDMADRFWRLVERFGYYGLAWLETIMRLADHRQSAEEASLQ